MARLMKGLEHTETDPARAARAKAEGGTQRTPRSRSGSDGGGRDERPPMDACPVCGRLKYVASKAGNRLLLCREDDTRFKQVRQAAVTQLAKNPASGVVPPTKVEWALAQMLDLTVDELRQVSDPADLAKAAKAAKASVQSDLKVAEDSYRGAWEDKVLSALVTAGVVESNDVEWTEDKRTGLPYAKIQFTPEAFRSNLGRELRTTLQKQELSAPYGEMRALDGILGRFDEVVHDLVGKIFSGDDAGEDEGASDSEEGFEPSEEAKATLAALQNDES